MPIIGNILKPLAKSVFIPLGLTAAVSATDAVIHKKVFGWGTTTLIISNEEISDMKIIQSLCALAAGIKKYKSIIKKKKKKPDEIVLLATSNLNSTEVLISKGLIDSVISRDEFILTNSVLKELAVSIYYYLIKTFIKKSIYYHFISKLAN